MAKNLISSNSNVGRAFIAGSDKTLEGTWIFPRTGLNVTYLNWSFNQPDNNSDEDCLEIMSSNGGLQFGATPNFISRHSTKTLSLKCIWSERRKVEMMHIVQKTNQGFENIATLNHPDDTNITSVQAHTRHNMEVTHFKNQNSITLSVLLLKPSSLDAGTYMCRVTGINAWRSSFQVNESLNVELKEYCSLHQMYFGPKAFNNRLYYLSKFKVPNVQVAISKCQSLGGYLMEVDDQLELDKAYQLAATTNVARAYIAGSDESEENIWVYPRTGLNMTFKQWKLGQPDNSFYYKGENCVEIYLSHGRFMNDVSCYFDNAFFCEIEVLEI